MAKSSKSYKIAVVPGDGTGPEVVAEAVKVINAAAGKFGFKLDLTHFDFGGERYKRTGETLPAELVKTSCRYGAMTFDNGKEFAGFKELELGLGMRSYFANPYHSRERGTNENTSSALSEGNEFCTCQTASS